MASKPAYEYFLVSTPLPFVAHVEVNRPKKMNAFFHAMWIELRSIFDALSVDPDVRAVILSGAGKAFTTGLDVQAANLQNVMNDADVARKAVALRRHIQEFQESISSVENCEKRTYPPQSPGATPRSAWRGRVPLTV